MRWGRRLQLVAVAVAIVAYSGLSHYSNSNPQSRDLATILALAPMLTIGFALIWRWNGILLAVLLSLVALLFLRRYWPLLTNNFSIVYLIQQCGFYVLMSLTFGRSLLTGRVPLCTQLADKVHGPLSPLELRYTRSVTLSWTLFFLANLAVTFVLFAFAPLRIWSLFVNFFSLPLVLLMFVAEFAVRRRVLPQVQRHGLLATLRVYFASPP
jgi:uncharacterized membrane protein